MVVTSVVLFTFRSYWRGVWCDDCRRVAARQAQAWTMLTGWWGIPFGLIFTPYALARNGGGGRKPADANATLLRAAGAHLIGTGDVREAVRAFEAAQSLQFDPNAAEILDQIYGALPSGPAGTVLHTAPVHPAGPSRAGGPSSRPTAPSPKPVPAAPPRSGSGNKGCVPMVVAVLALVGLLTFAARGLGDNSSAGRLGGDYATVWTPTPVGLVVAQPVKPTPTPYQVPTSTPDVVAIMAEPAPTPYGVPTDASVSYEDLVASGASTSSRGLQAGFVENSQQRGGPIRLTNEPGESMVYYPDSPVDPAAFSWRATITSLSGDGEVCLSLANSDESVWWLYNVDAQRGTWSVDRTNDAGQLFEWVTPKRLPASVGTVREIAVKVVEGHPALLVNGADVTGPLNIVLPAVNGPQIVGLCANGSRSVTGQAQVLIDEVELGP